jgi:L-amino acid N-acyltransferase YncA
VLDHHLEPPNRVNPRYGTGAILRVALKEVGTIRDRESKLPDGRPTIRTAVRRDAAAAAAIYAHHVAHGSASFDTEPRSEAQVAAKIAECSMRGWPFLVAEVEDQVVGYAYTTQFRDRPAYSSTCENSIYVGPGHVGQGIGTLLLTALIEASEKAGFRQMIAVVGGAEPASVALHRKAGFVEAGRMRSVGRKFGRWLDTLYLQKSLGSGDQLPPEVEP